MEMDNNQCVMEEGTVIVRGESVELVSCESVEAITASKVQTVTYTRHSQLDMGEAVEGGEVIELGHRFSSAVEVEEVHSFHKHSSDINVCAVSAFNSPRPTAFELEHESRCDSGERVALMTASEYWSLYGGSGCLSSIQQRVYQTMRQHESKTASLSQQISQYQQRISQLQLQLQQMRFSPTQPLTEEQEEYAAGFSCKETAHKMAELAHLVDSKITNEQQEQVDFISLLKEQYELSQHNIATGLEMVSKVFTRKTIRPLLEGFEAITGIRQTRIKMYLRQSVLTTMANQLTNKIKQNQQYAFRTILKTIKIATFNTENQKSMKFKAKMLLSLKEYPRLSKKRALHHWYMQTTSKGLTRLNQVSDRFVLFTNVNKITAFYRLLKQARLRIQIRSPKENNMQQFVRIIEKHKHGLMKHWLRQALSLSQHRRQKQHEAEKEDEYLRKVHAVQALFSQLTHSTLTTYDPIMRNSFRLIYNNAQIKVIKKYLTKVITVRKDNTRKLFEVVKQSLPKKNNKWLKRSAQILALNTRINTQKSFWRLKQNIYTKGTVSANFVVALKKLYNYVRKHYELNMYKVFLTIDKYGKNLIEEKEIIIKEQEVRMTQKRTETKRRMPRATERFGAHHNQSQYIKIQEEHQLLNASEFRENISRILGNNRKTAIASMTRIFSKNMRRRLQKWKRNVFEGAGMLKMKSEFLDSSDFLSACKMGAMDAVYRISYCYLLKLKAKAFYSIEMAAASQSTQMAYDRSLDERYELMTRQTELIEEMRSFKEERQTLIVECEGKDKRLRESNEAVSLLSLRINYMIAQKFMGHIEKVYDAVEFRNVNDAFDEIVEEANINYEREELPDF